MISLEYTQLLHIYIYIYCIPYKYTINSKYYIYIYIQWCLWMAEDGRYSFLWMLADCVFKWICLWAGMPSWYWVWIGFWVKCLWTVICWMNDLALAVEGLGFTFPLFVFCLLFSFKWHYWPDKSSPMSTFVAY